MHFDHRLLNRPSRRAFLRSTTSIAALAQLRWAAKAAVAPRQNTLTYVAFRQSSEGKGNSLHVFSLHGKRWSKIQTVPSRSPSCVLLSQDQKTLYVANQVGVHEGLPRGTVEAFSIDPSDGRLRLISQQALSLSATNPRHMVLSPNGRLLAVAADDGAMYNLLPISPDGSLDRPCSIFKQCGLYTRPQAQVHPYRLLFDATGKHLFSSGFGDDHIRAFTLAQNSTSHRMQQRLAEVDDLDTFAFHPDGSAFYAWHKQKNSLSSYRYDSVSGKIGEAIQRTSMPTHLSGTASLKVLAIHPSGRMLYTAQTMHNQLQAWHIDAQSGHLSHAKNLDFDDAPGNEIIVASDRSSLFVMDYLRGLVHQVTVDAVTGEPSFVEEVAMIHGAQNIAFKTL
jgi:6-phosphogluconolactonase